MGVLEKRHIDTLTEAEEGWRRTLVNGTEDGRIPEGESMQELSVRMHAALAECLKLPAGSRPLLVSHGIALGCLVSTILGLPAYAERRLRLRNCSISRIDYQESAWLASGWVVEMAGDISHLDAPALDELQR
jgi:probable phosphoglycerate mutase